MLDGLGSAFQSFGSMINPATGYGTAAAAAHQAQQQANALSQLQWSRQMQGLGQSTQYVDQLQQLYNSLYGPGKGQMAPGGSSARAPAMASLAPPPSSINPNPPPKVTRKPDATPGQGWGG